MMGRVVMKKIVLVAFLVLSCCMGGSGYCSKVLNNDGTYTVGVMSDALTFFSAPEGYGRQRSANWCWAACIQMVLNYHGVPIAQEALVEKVFGSLVDQPADMEKIVFALNGWGTDSNGRDVVVSAIPYEIDEEKVIHDLEYNWPLIIGLKGSPIGHAYVLTALSYSVGANGEKQIQAAVLRDPWPKSQSRVTLSWQEFMQRVMLITRVSVVRDY